jgi:hypothetical protein
MPNLHLLTQTFSQARHASGTHQFNGLGPPLTENQEFRSDIGPLLAGGAAWDIEPMAEQVSEALIARLPEV